MTAVRKDERPWAEVAAAHREAAKVRPQEPWVTAWHIRRAEHREACIAAGRWISPRIEDR
jgi:hypothetical protein